MTVSSAIPYHQIIITIAAKNMWNGEPFIFNLNPT